MAVRTLSTDPSITRFGIPILPRLVYVFWPRRGTNYIIEHAIDYTAGHLTIYYQCSHIALFI